LSFIESILSKTLKKIFFITI